MNGPFLSFRLDDLLVLYFIKCDVDFPTYLLCQDNKPMKEKQFETLLLLQASWPDQTSLWFKQTHSFLFIMINDHQFNRHKWQTSSESMSASLRHVYILSHCCPYVHILQLQAIIQFVANIMLLDRKEPFSFPDSSHSSLAPRPIYSEWSKLFPMALASRNGLLRVVSPQKSLREREHGLYLLIQTIAGSLANSPVAKQM